MGGSKGRTFCPFLIAFRIAEDDNSILGASIRLIFG